MFLGIVMIVLGLIVVGLTASFRVDPKSSKLPARLAVLGAVVGTTLMVIGFNFYFQELWNPEVLPVLPLAALCMLGGVNLRGRVRESVEQTSDARGMVYYWFLTAISLECFGAGMLLSALF